MRRWTLLLSVCCAGPAMAQVPVADVTALLTPRHAGAACDAVDALGDADAVVQALIETADTVTMPPWVGTRAAHCVAERIDASPLALDTAVRWVGSPDSAGFALIVLGQLPQVAAPSQERLLQAVQPRVAADPTFAAHARPLLDAASAGDDAGVRTP